MIGKILRKGVLNRLSPKKRLPFYFWLCGFEGFLEIELVHLSAFAKGKGAAVDIGANQGLYSYKMSKIFPKVYSFEINDTLMEKLIAYNPGNIEIINKGISSQSGNAVLYIPVLKGQPLYGWASLSPNNCPDTQEHIEKPVDICPLDTFQLDNVSFIKIDVEGHEVEVLKGAVQTLKQCRPTVLIEIKEENLSEVRRLFANVGYQQQSLKDLLGISGSEQNYIFVPMDKVGIATR
jgi:FkbM family methyltransferase